MTIKLNRRQALLGATAISLTAAGCGTSRPAPPEPSGAFRHGVASGEPDATSVVLWTAITEDGGGERGVEVARDEAFSDIVFEQFESRTHIRMNPVSTVKIIADGLVPGTSYFYRFRFNDEYSPVGRTRTLPDGAVEQYRVAVCSCSNYPAGYFNAYAELAVRGDVDLVLHLGDYIYEYGMGGYATDDAEEMDRVPVPAHECLSQADYAARHALYKSDPDLQAAHASAPWFIMWDDHEVANDAWSDGAENHNPDSGEGAYSDRRAGALRAFHDWNPTREPEDLIGTARRIEIGNLATIAITESRHTARTEQLTFDSFPIPADAEDTPENRALVSTWLRDVVGDPSREMLGAPQIAEIADLFAASRADGKPWQILGGQVLLGKVTMPNYVEVLPGWLKWYVRNNDDLAWSYIQRSRFDSPFSFDSWDGYPAERERLYAALNESSGQFIALAGDTHNFWTCDLRNAAGERAGFEFGTTSITSPSPFEAVPAPGVHFGRITEANNAEILHHEPYAKGFMVLTLGREAIETEFVEVSTIRKRGYSASTESRWRVRRNGEALEIEAV
tara:strand:- start:4337 stop:6022 length:1686 start_codon:yes stop_codon:yes gene_type:complete